MGATEEQMAFLSNANVSHVSYILLLYSVAFLLFLFVCILLHLYASYAWHLAAVQPKATTNRGVNGHVGHINGRVRDAEEFELEGLMSDEEGTNLEDGEIPIKNKEVNGRVG